MNAPGSLHTGAPLLAALPLRVDRSAAALLARPGRSEGMAISPSGGVIVMVGSFGRILLARLSVEHDAAGRATSVSLFDAVDAMVPGWIEPHGVAFVDDGLLLLGDRDHGIGLFEIPASHIGGRPADRPVPADEHVAEPEKVALRQVLDVTDASAVGGVFQSAVVVGPRLPGAARRHDVFGCDTGTGEVVRHAVGLDEAACTPTARVVDAERLESPGHMPDGLALSPDGRWLAVALHDDGRVAVVRLAERAGGGGPQVVGGVATASHPHSPAFADGGRALIVTDAGAPVIVVAHAPDGDWSGERQGVALRVMDDRTHALAATGPDNGGPKGLAVDERLGIVVVTSAAQRFAAFPLDVVIGDRTAPGTDDHGTVPAAADDDRDAHITRLERRLAELNAGAVAHRRRVGRVSGRQEAAVRLVVAMERSAPWRLLVWLRYGGRVRRAMREHDRLESDIARRVGAGSTGGD